jgi:hypothetical protein
MKTNLLLELVPHLVLLLALDEEAEVIEAIDDEAKAFTLVHGEQNLLDDRVAANKTEFKCENK